jgi:hypothetical protein
MSAGVAARAMRGAASNVNAAAPKPRRDRCGGNVASLGWLPRQRRILSARQEAVHPEEIFSNAPRRVQIYFPNLARRTARPPTGRAGGDRAARGRE